MLIDNALIGQIESFLRLIEPNMSVTEHHWREAAYLLSKIDQLQQSNRKGEK